jgi:ribose transport system substrate-binding protein
MSPTRHMLLKRCAGAAVAVVCVSLLSACGGSESDSASTDSTTKSAVAGTVEVAASGGCGTVPAEPATDPQGLLAGLGDKYASSYVGFQDYPLEKSAWASWKPARSSGWNVQVIWAPLTNPFVIAALDGLKQELKASGKVKTIQVQAPASPMDVPQQLQMIQTAVERKPDLLVVFPLAGAAAAPVIAKAGEAGIPTVSPSTGIPGKYSVSVNQNLYLSEGLAAAGVLGLMGGKGSVLQVHGVKGTPNDVIAGRAWEQALSRCPDVKVAGSVEGQFDNTATKAGVQKFLATHPSGVQGVFQAGVMGLGVLGAFTQTGHTPPPMSDQAASQGAIAYWHNHPEYNMFATLVPDTDLGGAAARVALRMLDGDGIKLNVLLDQTYMVTRANLGQAFKPSFKEGSPAGAVPPPGSFMSDDYLDGFFARSAK